MTTAQTEVKSRPIIFTGPMVKAILEGRKTQDRRAIKPMPFIDYPTGFRLQQEYKLEHHPKCSFVQAGMLCDCQAIYEPWKAERKAACSFGKPGDRLWVKEGWHLWGPPEHQFLDYAATNPEAADLDWKSPIFMPRWASRITLEVTSVRVERLWEISENDIRAEGFKHVQYRGYTKRKIEDPDDYSDYWDFLNGKKFPWASNPWVWIIGFKLVDSLAKG